VALCLARSLAAPSAAAAARQLVPRLELSREPIAIGTGMPTIGATGNVGIGLGAAGLIQCRIVIAVERRILGRPATSVRIGFPILIA
jgi:hypothetical protein